MAHHDTVFREMLDVANRHDLDGFQGYLADEIAFENPITGPTDTAGMRAFHSGFFAAFPDIAYHITNLVTSPDTVVAECTIKGTHQADLMGIPATHKHMSMPAAFVVRFRGGKVDKWTSYFDSATLMRQLGVTP